MRTAMMENTGDNMAFI